MSRTRIKICGITRREDAWCAIQAGADAIGLVFYSPSPRSVSIEQAWEVTAGLPPFISIVGLFVDAEPAEVERVLAAVPLTLLQFHGDEPESYCRQFERPYIKALRMRPQLEVAQAMAAYPSASGILLDAYQPGVPGGTGATFDWQRVPRNPTQPVILAGGLTPENVGRAIEQTCPYAVDVSGGVEAAKGIKDPEKIKRFVRGITCVQAKQVQ